MSLSKVAKSWKPSGFPGFSTYTFQPNFAAWIVSVGFFFRHGTRHAGEANKQPRHVGWTKVKLSTWITTTNRHAGMPIGPWVLCNFFECLFFFGICSPGLKDAVSPFCILFRFSIFSLPSILSKSWSEESLKSPWHHHCTTHLDFYSNITYYIPLTSSYQILINACSHPHFHRATGDSRGPPSVLSSECVDGFKVPFWVMI